MNLLDGGMPRGWTIAHGKVGKPAFLGGKGKVITIWG